MAEKGTDAPETEEDAARGEEKAPRTGFRRRLVRLLNQKELVEDTSAVLGGMLEMSDRAKTEAVRLVAREARNYLDEMKIKEGLMDLVTSHSLEVKLSVHLKPLADTLDAAGPVVHETRASPPPVEDKASRAERRAEKRAERRAEKRAEKDAEEAGADAEVEDA